MKKIYCDLCKKEIKPEDLHTELPLNIGSKHFDIDMHSACYYKFIQALREDLLGETYTVNAENLK